MIPFASPLLHAAAGSAGKSLADWNAHVRALVPSATGYNSEGIGGKGNGGTVRGQGAPGFNTNELLFGTPRPASGGNFGNCNLRGLARHCIDSIDYAGFDGSSDLLIVYTGNLSVFYPPGTTYNGFTSTTDTDGYAATYVTYCAYWTPDGAVEVIPATNSRQPYTRNGWTP